MNALVRAISGPLQGTVFRLVEEEVTIGRQSSNFLCIGDPSVSRFHCVIKAEDCRYKVTDLKSHNGTLVNGNVITESFLKTGDYLGVGDTVFEFLEDSSDLPALPMDISDQQTVAGLRTFPGDRSAHPSENARELAVIAKIGQLLNSKRGLENLESQILEAICSYVGAERGAAFIAREGEWVVFSWHKREGPPPADFANREIVDQALRQGKAIIAEAPAAGSGSEGSDGTVHRSISVLAIPLLIRDAVSGVIYLERCEAPRPFTEDDLKFVSAVSNFAAVVLDYSRSLEHLEAENHRMREEAHLTHEIVGQSAPMKEVYKRIARIAPTDTTVLICGETGTGKELAARAIHDNSLRAGQAFQAINCALLNESLLESELFGHERGAFTGAVTQKKGKLELADEGTVFLDELAELPERAQSMLLRVLQEHVFERVGGTKKIHVNIRIIAATNKDLEDAVRNHTFRLDLYYRVNVVSISLPPLRDRRDDIPMLVEHLLRRSSQKNKRSVISISRQAMAYLQGYDWPGNVRELENAIEHAVVFGSTDEVMPEDLPERILDRARPKTVSALSYQDALRSAKRQIVLDALQRADGNNSKAAKLLHIHLNNFYRLVRDLDIGPPRSNALKSE
jgi:transcriptional regulator with GAF, ATPase, and Fis domain